MDENKLIFSIPAEISILPSKEINFQDKNSFVTPVKLKVFYKGTTPDGRTFTEDFSSKVIETLPQTPVVAYYDEEDEDFVGHNDEQYVYGYVPEVGEVSFEEIDGKTWAVTDIVLFTGRDDNIGKVAKKIIGKKHSLELDKNTTKYELKRDKFGKITEMVFTEGNIIGLSVLGDSQTPGFTGSAFFTTQEKTIQELIHQYMDIKQELQISNFTELFSNENKNNDGGVEMNFSTETIASMNNFMKETYDEKIKKVFDAAIDQFGQYIYIMQVSEDMIVFADYEDGKYYRTTYTSSEEGFTFGDKVEVKARFLTDEEINNTFEQIAAVGTTGEVGASGFRQEPQGPDSAEGVITPNGTTLLYSGSTVDFATSTLTYQGLTTLPQNGYLYWEDSTTAGGWVWDFYTPQEPQTITITDTTTVAGGVFVTQAEYDKFIAEREELENYRKDKKLAIVKKFSKFLTEEEVKNYTDKLGEFSIAELEKELSFQSMQKLLASQQEEEQENNGQFKASKILNVNEGTGKSAVDQTNDLIKRYK